MMVVYVNYFRCENRLVKMEKNVVTTIIVLTQFISPSLWPSFRSKLMSQLYL